MASGGVSAELVARGELVEALGWKDLCLAAPRDFARLYGIGVEEFDGVVAGRARGLDVLAFNRAIALGVRRPASTATLDAILEWYRTGAVPRVFVPIAPTAAPADLGDRLRARGFVHYNNWAKLFRRSDHDVPADTDLVIEPVDRSQAGRFGTIVAEAFGWASALGTWLAATVGRDGWSHYLAYDGDEPVGGGTLFVAEGMGWLSFAGTRTVARGKGAQSALIARRIADARAMGCDWITVETAEERRDRPAPAFRNVRRLGFDLAYLRPNYLLHLGEGAAA